MIGMVAKLDLSLSASLDGFFFGVVVAEVDAFAFMSNSRQPFAERRIPADADMPAIVVGVAFYVASILGKCDRPEIAPTVVVANAIDVVGLFRGERSCLDQKSKSMLRTPLSIQVSDYPISLPIDVSSTRPRKLGIENLPNTRSRKMLAWSDLIGKDPSFRVVVKCLAGVFCGKMIFSHAEPLIQVGLWKWKPEPASSGFCVSRTLGG